MLIIMKIMECHRPDFANLQDFFNTSLQHLLLLLPLLLLLFSELINSTKFYGIFIVENNRLADPVTLLAGLAGALLCVSACERARTHTRTHKATNESY